SQFDALKAQVGPNAAPFAGSQLLGIDALPGAKVRGFYGFIGAPDLVEVLSPPAGVTDLDLTFTYGNPFTTGGTAWDEFVIARYEFHVPVLAQGATSPSPLTAVLDVDIPVASLMATGNITPALSPPRNVKIAGMDATMTRTGVGATPMISWDAPTIGTATSYRVDIYSVSAMAGATQLKI